MDLDPRVAAASPRETVADTPSGRERSPADDARPSLVRVGRFLVVDKVGEGGMGTVYRAYDPDLDRRVAVKVLRYRDDDERATARLLREAKTMAQLNHPNVVTVHDVGVHEGRVFVAMEYVDGGTLAQWCHARGPGDPSRCDALIDLLRQATTGLAAAHAAGLVHRDVKPANMLIDRAGRLRVADFGLAGSFPRGGSSDAASHDDGSPASRPSGLTATKGVRGTPAFMAPEQFLGHADARSDQFSLCSSFYEAFFAARPFGGEGIEQRLARIATGRIERPAAGYAAPSWIRELLVRGLQDEPERRWATLDEMLAAIASGTGRTGRRWRTAGLVGGIAIAGGAIALFARTSDPCVDGPSTFARVWNDEQRTAVRDAFVGLDAPFARDAVGALVTELDDYGARWAEGWRDACESTRVQRTQSDELMAQRIRCLDASKRQFEHLVTNFAAADGTIASNAFRSIAALPQVSNCADPEFVQAQLPMPDDPELAAEVEAVLIEAERSDAAIDAGKYEDAFAIATSAVERATRVDYPAVRARALTRLARARFARGLPEEALAAALSAFELVADTDATGAAEVSSALALVYQDRGRFKDALAHLRRARAIDARLLGENAVAVGSLDGRIATALEFLGDYDEAIAGQRRAVATIEAALGARHPLAAVTRTGLGRALRSKGELDEAEECERDALAVLEASLGPMHPELAWTLDELGHVADARGRYDEALAYAERSRSIRVATFGADHPALYRSEANLGEIYDELGRADEAVAAYRRAIEILARTTPPDAMTFAPLHGSLGSAYQNRGDSDLALAEYRAALALYDRHFGEGHPQTATLHTNIGSLLEGESRYDEALPHLQRALAILTKALGEDNVQLAATHATIGYVLAALGRTDDALFHHGRALALDMRALGREHPDVASDLNAIGFVLGPAGEYERALAQHREALAIYERVVGPDNPNVMWAHLGIAYALADRGEMAAAADAFAASTAIAIARKGDTHRDTALPVAGTALCAAALGHDRIAADARAHLRRIVDTRRAPALERLTTAMAGPRTRASEPIVRAARAELEQLGERGFFPVIDRWLATN